MVPDEGGSGGPAPDADGIWSGPVYEVPTRSAAGNRSMLRLQVWRPDKDAVRAGYGVADEPPWRQEASDVGPRSHAAMYHAWAVAGDTGIYGVFDGVGQRVWFGTGRPTVDEEEYDYVAIGTDLCAAFAEAFTAKGDVGAMSYPHSQSGPLRIFEGPSLVPYGVESTALFALPVTSWWERDDVLLRLQGWRPEGSNAVYVDADWNDIGGEVRQMGALVGGPRFGPRVRILLDAFDLDSRAALELFGRFQALRDDDLTGLVTPQRRSGDPILEREDDPH